MDSPRVDSTENSSKLTQVTYFSPSRSDGQAEEENGTKYKSKASLQISSSRIQKVCLVKLTPLEKEVPLASSPLSPNTLTRLVEEQTKSHEAIEALQQRIQADTADSFTSEIRKELEQSALKQRHFLNQVLSTPTPISRSEQSAIEQDDQPTMLQNENVSPLVKRLFPDGYRLEDDIRENGSVSEPSNRSPGSENGVEPGRNSPRKGSFKRNKSDTDNDTGVETDSGSDAGIENSSPFRTFLTSPDIGSGDDFSSFGQVSPLQLKSMSSENSDDDQLLLYLEAIEQRAMAVAGLIEKAKLDTVVNIRQQLEAEFNGTSLEEIPSKCHQKIDRAIQRYLQRELENIKAEYENKRPGDHARGDGEGLRATKSRITKQEEVELVRENGDLKEKVESLEMSVSRVDMLYVVQKKENEYLTEKISKLDRQMANEKLKHESELDYVKNGYEEDMKTERGSLKEKLGNELESVGLGGIGSSEKIASLYRKLEQEEKQNVALKIAGEADQTMIRCLEEKVTEVEGLLSNSRKEVSDLLSEVRAFQERDEQRDKSLKQYEAHLKEMADEKHVLRETLIMSEHEISLLENKLGNDNNSAWKDSKKEILEELRKLEKHIKVIHKEKRKLENKFLAFKIENENLSDSLNSFSRTKDILTPLGSCDVSRRESTLSSHSSSLSSSHAGSDLEEEDLHDGLRGKKNKFLHHQSGRRRRRIQDHKDKQFAEAVAKKLLFAQKSMKDQNCNFSTFENSGQDLYNEVDKLEKRVDNLQAEKRAIKIELESIRSTQTETVKC